MQQESRVVTNVKSVHHMRRLDDMLAHRRLERKGTVSFCRRTVLCSVAMLALLLGFPTPSTALIHFVRGYQGLGRLALGRERKVTRIGVEAEAATDPTEGLTNSSGLTQLNLEEMEAWLDEAGVDRRSGTGGAPAGRLKCFAERGIGLEATVELERDSTVRNSECVGSLDSSTHRCICVRFLHLSDPSCD